MSQEEIVAPKGWELKKFGDVITNISDFQSNGSFAGLAENVKRFKEKNYAVLVRLTDLRNNLKIDSNFVYTDKHGYDFLKKSSLHGGEILVANIGAGRGTTIIMPKIDFKATLAPNMYKITLSEKVHPNYFLYFPKSQFFANEIRKITAGGAQPKFNKNEYRSIQFLMPSLPIQKQIVAKLDHILGELEVKKKQILSLIEQNKERIDFFEKNWISYMIKNELEKDSQQKGWISSTIEEISEIKGSGTIPVNENLGTELHFIRVSDMNLKENFQYILKTNSSITTSKKNILDRSIPPNSIIIPKRGGAILTNKKRITSNYSILDPNIMAIIPTDEIEPLFLYYFFLKTNLAQFVGGEVIPQLNKYDIAPLEIKYPKEREAQNKIIQNIKSAEEKFQLQKKQFENIKKNYESKINYINHIQSSILDSAFSGKIF